MFYRSSCAVKLAASVEESLGTISRNAGTGAGNLFIHSRIMFYAAGNISPCSILLQQDSYSHVIINPQTRCLNITSSPQHGVDSPHPNVNCLQDKLCFIVVVCDSPGKVAHYSFQSHTPHYTSVPEMIQSSIRGSLDT